MIRSLAAILTLAAGWSFTDLTLDRLRWNARERTATGIEALEAVQEPEAIEAFETAARLDSDAPILSFNAGSAHLVAGSDGALEHLERAAEFAPDELRAPANYNLGNAWLGAGDTAQAIAAYEETLRLAPDHQDAKFNLELALKQQQQEQEQQEQDKKDQKEQGDKPENQKPEDQQPPEDQDDEGQEQQQNSNEQEQDGQDQKPDDGDRDQQLPQFEEQPDMTAEQAAAILEAVENLEREQRRKQAEQEMKKRPRKGKDW